MNPNAKLFFTEGTILAILKESGKGVNEDGFIIDSTTGELILTPEGEEMHYKNLGGIKKGSEIFIKDDLYSVIKLAEGNY